MNKIARIGLVVMAASTLGFGFATDANALPGAKPKGATLGELAAPSSPEISSAEQRVEQAKAQVDLANKQVSASRALLKAAQADLRAATTQLDALKLSAHAQGLVDQTGMTPAKAAPVSIAAKAPVEPPKDQTVNTSAPTPAVAPTPAPAAATDSDRIKPDFNAEPASEPIQLR